ncbi:PseG/SpsG family protein [Maridesulfovibrio zosterae]|uniref:PseG/SpsG family protein n=1 Tax=Maridesulfovibrio zosterae TaxID=82171 RepID=UPI000409B072|nr:acylneuraminate cytidylyltransferase [Maridesulfovibrio zosterae]
MNRKPQFLFFCEGSAERGLGHVGRCIALADVIRRKYQRESRFVFRGSSPARNKIIEAGFVVSSVTDYNDWKFSIGDVAILDLLIPLDNIFFDDAKRKNVLLCSIDDPTTNRIKCDLVFYPPVPQVMELDWTDFEGELFQSWDCIPLRKEFSNPHKVATIKNSPSILISMGGSDPANLTVTVLQALHKIHEKWTAKIIAGPMFNSLDKIKYMTVVQRNKIEIVSNVSNMAELMNETDLAVASFGMTAYELAACRVPQLLLCLTDDHARSASALHQSGAAVSLGRYDLISEQSLLGNMQKLISDTQLRKHMSAKAAQLNVENGASNIARIIIKRVEQKQ